MVAVTAGPVQQAEAQDLAITVMLRNDADIFGRALETSTKAASAIYGRAGVTVTWVENQEADLTVVLLPRERAAKMRQRSTALGVAPGTATRRGRIAYILMHRVDEVAVERQVNTDIVLGIAIAHEMGHLLLPYDSHSQSGIMRASWNQHDFQRALQGTLNFTSQQAATIRDAVESLLMPTSALAGRESMQEGH